MQKPLEGILVVSIEQAVAAPLCSAKLAEAGARVIKIERAEGDFARNYDQAAAGESSYFIWLNQGKESLTLNFKDKDEADLLHRIISKADILIQNLSPGALERSGFGTTKLREQYPKLITCDISGYGENEEVKSLKSYDLLIQAESGLISLSGGPGEMGRIGVSACDIGAGMAAHAAVMEALFLRSQTGKGSGVKISLFDVMAEWMTVPYIHSEYGDVPPKRVGLKHPSIAPYDAYETKDGVKVIVSIQNEREWKRFCEIALQGPDVTDDERFNTNNKRVKNRDELDGIIMSVVSELSSDEYQERLKQADLAYGVVNDVKGLANHLALRKRNVSTADGKSIEIPAASIQWDNKREQEVIGTPSIGNKTQSIKEEFSK